MVRVEKMSDDNITITIDGFWFGKGNVIDRRYVTYTVNIKIRTRTSVLYTHTHTHTRVCGKRYFSRFNPERCV